MRRIEELRPVAVTEPVAGHQVVDLGQNINGWVRLSGLGPAGTEVTLTHGEALDDRGDVTIEHLLSADHTTGERLGEIQVDRVVAGSEPDEVFEPRHTTHGFQYVRIEGLDRRLEPDDVTGVVVHTDLRRTGWFHCSDERINRLHEAAVWSFRDNACDIPTDCPQRERSGWTGDWQLFVPTAAFLYDVAGFSLKWLRDLAAEQRADGLVLNIAPEPRRPALWDDPDRRVPPGLGGLGRRRGDRPVGAVPGLRRPRPGRGAVAAHGRLGRTSPSAGPGRAADPSGSRRGRSPPTTRRSSGTPASTGASGASPAATTSVATLADDMATSPRRTSTAPPTSCPASPACSAGTPTPSATATSPTAPATRGRSSTSARTGP